MSNRVSEKLNEIARSLPEGVFIKPVYNRSDLVNATIATVRQNLLEGALLVIAILLAHLATYEQHYSLRASSHFPCYSRYLEWRKGD